MSKRFDEPRDREPEPPSDPEAVARTLLLNALDRRAHTSAELATLLRKRGIPDDVAERLLARFDEVGLVDDAGFAHAWVSDRQQRRALSKRALRQELQRKGVSREDADEALDAVSGEDEFSAALAFAESRVRRLAGLDPVVQRRRLMGALARRGFGSGIVTSVVAQVLSGDESNPFD